MGPLKLWEDENSQEYFPPFCVFALLQVRIDVWEGLYVTAAGCDSQDCYYDREALLGGVESWHFNQQLAMVTEVGDKGNSPPEAPTSREVNGMP